MVKRAGQKTIGTSAVVLVNAIGYRSVLGIANLDTGNKVYIDSDPGVTSSTGFPIMPGTILWLNKGLGDEPWLGYWIVSDGASSDIRIIEEFNMVG